MKPAQHTVEKLAQFTAKFCMLLFGYAIFFIDFFMIPLAST